MHNLNLPQDFSKLRTIFVTISKMSKKSKKPQAGVVEESKEVTHDAVSLDKMNNVLIQVLAKPGSKQNKITEITPEGIGIQINAPPTEGEANKELMQYVSSLLGLRKSDVVFHKGFKSRSKTLKIAAGSITIDEVRKKFESEMSTS